MVEVKGAEVLMVDLHRNLSRCRLSWRARLRFQSVDSNLKSAALRWMASVVSQAPSTSRRRPYPRIVRRAGGQCRLRYLLVGAAVMEEVL